MHQYHILKNVSRITRDIIRVFYRTIMAVCRPYIFTSFDFDYHESKLAHVHHILDKFSFI